MRQLQKKHPDKSILLGTILREGLQRQGLQEIPPMDRAYHTFMASMNTARSPIEANIQAAMKVIGADKGSIFTESNGKLEPYFSLIQDGNRSRITFQNGSLPKHWTYAYQNELIVFETKEKNGLLYVYNMNPANMDSAKHRISAPRKERLIIPILLQEGDAKKQSQKLGLLVLSGEKLGIKGGNEDRFSLFVASVSRAVAKMLHERFDSLTKIAKRLEGYMLLKGCIEAYAATGAVFTVIFTDVDGFKQNVNERFGYPAGSRVLTEVAHVLKDAAGHPNEISYPLSSPDAIQPVDRTFRWGGDEDLIILPGMTADGAKKIAERARRHVERHKIFVRAEGEAERLVQVPVTCSFGVVEISNVMSQKRASNEIRKKNGRGVDDIMAKLIGMNDRATKAAKRCHKNLVVVARRDERRRLGFFKVGPNLMEERIRK
ncbi:MAG: GGDEF domain-containing protein [Candidatus Micrarchaeota archaeon]